MRGLIIFTIIFSAIFFVKCYDSFLPEDHIDFPCLSDEDCVQTVGSKKTTCEDSKCICYSSSNKTVECKPKKSKIFTAVGGPCPCSVENSYCETNTPKCLCQENYTASQDLRRCIKKSVPLGDKCETDNQCIQFDKSSMCDLETRVCACQPNFTLVGEVCHNNIGLDNRCDTSAECRNHTLHSFCSGHRCICDSGYVAKLDKTVCLPSVKYGEACMETPQCQQKLGSGSICDNGICICDNNHYNIKRDNEILCEKKMAAGDVCSEHTDCYYYEMSESEQTMECLEGICICREGFTLEKRSCIKNSAVTLNLETVAIALVAFLIGANLAGI